MFIQSDDVNKKGDFLRVVLKEIEDEFTQRGITKGKVASRIKAILQLSCDNHAWWCTLVRCPFTKGVIIFT